MHKDIAKKWIKALTSGKYKQTQGRLRNNDSFCCLGVLCNLHAQEHPEIAKKQTNPNVYLGQQCVLPDSVRQWADMDSDNGLIYKTKSLGCLSEMNDQGKGFKEIAKIIENNIEYL